MASGKPRFMPVANGVVCGDTFGVSRALARKQATRPKTAPGVHFNAAVPLELVLTLRSKLEGYARLGGCGDKPAPYRAWDDPVVMRLYLPRSPELKGVAVRLNEPRQHWPRDA